MSSDPIVVHVPADQIGRDLWNLDHGLPDDVPQWYLHPTCGLRHHGMRTTGQEGIDHLRECGGELWREDGPFPVTVTPDLDGRCRYVCPSCGYERWDWTEQSDRWGDGGPYCHVCADGGFTLMLPRQFSVSDVHHADECRKPHWRAYDHDTEFCHPDAEPGRWHWQAKEADRE